MLQFDEMQTLEHTKLKPLGICLAVSSCGLILQAKVCPLSYRGPMAQFARKKYGPREDRSQITMRKMLKSLKPLTDNRTKFSSDAKPSYRSLMKSIYPKSAYQQHQSREAKKREQVELLTKSHDPLFALNQRCAKLRSHLKRLTRRSWCTTKSPENLQKHLDLFLHQQFAS